MVPALPVLPPLQSTLFIVKAESDNAFGWVTTVLAVAEQPFLSVTLKV
jgi:hypothetical protein